MVGDIIIENMSATSWKCRVPDQNFLFWETSLFICCLNLKTSSGCINYLSLSKNLSIEGQKNLHLNINNRLWKHLQLKRKSL